MAAKKRPGTLKTRQEASRSSSLRMLEGSFDKTVREIIKIEETALKRGGH